MDIYTLHRGTAPLLISIPHDGSLIPDTLLPDLVDEARGAPDTDWHVSRLYDFARALGASILRPHHSRYVIDLNRPPDDVSLYPGQNTTGLCPTVRFTGTPVYRDGHAPTPEDIQSRIDTYWRPYHAALCAELERVRAEHGRVVLWEAHSIRSVVPFLFEGRLADLNLGTAGGASCTPALQTRLEAVMAGQGEYSFVSNGRFKGGYITRHYADVPRGVQAVQLELAQCNYMDEDSFEYLPERAERLQKVLRAMLEVAVRG